MQKYLVAAWSVRDVEYVSGLTTFFLSLSLNLLLMYLIMKKTNSELKAYGQMLLLNCVIDLIYATATVCAMLVSSTGCGQQENTALAT